MDSLLVTFALAFAAMVVFVLTMAVGVIVRGREIKGSCGGLNNGDGTDCACRGSCDGAPANPR